MKISAKINQSICTSLIICMFTISCTNDKKTLYENFNIERNIQKLSEIPLKENLSIVGRMTIIDSSIIIQSYRSTHNFYIFSLGNGECINKIVSYGRANNESQWANMENTNNNCFNYYDVNNNCIVQIKKNDLLNEIPESRKAKIIIDKSFMYGSDVTLLSDGRYLYVGLNPSQNSVFRITDTSSNLICDFGEAVSDKKNDESKNILPETQRGNITTSRNNTHFLFTSSYGSVFKFYNCTNKNEIPKLISSYIYDLPIYKEIPNGNMRTVATSKDNILGVLSATSDDNKYYLLYQDKTIIESDNKRTSNIVLVFDINGKPIEKLKLDLNVSIISYDKINNTLVGLHENDDGNSAFIHYSLN